jgi:hypothetical protein
MTRLEPQAYDRARHYLLNGAAALPRAVFRATFEDGGNQAVLAALAPFQNEDGGFGHGIEPDFHLPASSPMATSVAFGVLREVGATRDVPEASAGGRAVSYLVEHYDPRLPGWRAVPAEVNEHPHAPWWGRSAEALSQPIPPESWGNPNAELAGVLFEHLTLAPAEFAASVVADAVARLRETPRPIDPYVCLSYLRLAEVAPPADQITILDRLRDDAPDSLDPSNPVFSHFPVHWLAPTPDAPLADRLSERVEHDLDQQVSRQSPEGYWEPGWSWGPAYPEAWASAREAWRGVLTVRTLRALRAWGRIASA